LLVQTVERCSKVVLLVLEPVELIPTRVLEEVAAIRFCTFEEVLGMTGMSSAGSVLLGEALACVLANRLEHGEAAVSLADEALVDERGERLQIAVANGFGRLARTAAGEDRETIQELLLTRLEQVVAPGDGGPQRPLPLGCVPRPTREERQPLLQASEQSIGGQYVHARRRQLDRKRQSVEAAADFGHGAVRREVGP